MNIILLTINSEIESAESLGFDTRTFLGGYSEDYDNTIIIRWGNSELLCNKEFVETEFKNVINISYAIAQNCRKKEALQLIGKYVSTPTIYNKVPTNRLAVYRPIWHSGGNGFKVKKGPFNVDGDMYATQFIKTATELRAWHIADQTLVAKRIRLDCNGAAKKYECRSMWGYKFIRSNRELNNQVKKSLNAVGLEFGACDILLKNNKYYFLENNSAPTIDLARIRKFFKNGLNTLIGAKFGQNIEKELRAA